VPDSYLKTRLDRLKASQNPDGGWGYFPGKESWLEPTAYAAMALHGDPSSDRAWKLMLGWQQPDGSWRPSAKVNVSNWATSLCVLLAVARGEFGDPFQKGVNWLLNSSGVDTDFFSRLKIALGWAKEEGSSSGQGWSWKPNNSSWVEPTSHALIALRKAAPKISTNDSVRLLRQRVQTGEKQLLTTRSRDGGWNYGSPNARGVDLPSYPETTALALAGLQGTTGLESAFTVASSMMKSTPSPLARAWLTIAMRLHGKPVSDISDAPSPDIMIAAVEALAAADGNWKLMHTEVAA
jgi:hypothetical protein